MAALTKESAGPGACGPKHKMIPDLCYGFKVSDGHLPEPIESAKPRVETGSENTQRNPASDYTFGHHSELYVL